MTPLLIARRTEVGDITYSVNMGVNPVVANIWYDTKYKRISTLGH
jgi:hypothetical protein